MRHLPQASVATRRLRLQLRRDPLVPSISLEYAITTIEQRKHNLPYDAETVVRVDELDNVLEILRRVRP